MSFFYQFDAKAEKDRRPAAGLLRLREKLAQELPPRTIADTLMLATWNIREFDSNKYGERNRESISYIAEIISHFDQMAFISQDYDPEIVQERLTRCKAGVFNFFDAVYREKDEAVYRQEMSAGYAKAKNARDKTTYYRQWRTFHMSDHLPMWMELPIDFGKEYLERVAVRKKRG